MKTYIRVYDQTEDGRVEAEGSNGRNEWYDSMSEAMALAAYFGQESVDAETQIGFIWEEKK